MCTMCGTSVSTFERNVPIQLEAALSGHDSSVSNAHHHVLRECVAGLYDLIATPPA
jgi:hypothetical protein